MSVADHGRYHASHATAQSLRDAQPRFRAVFASQRRSSGPASSTGLQRSNASAPLKRNASSSTPRSPTDCLVATTVTMPTSHSPNPPPCPTTTSPSNPHAAPLPWHRSHKAAARPADKAAADEACSAPYSAVACRRSPRRAPAATCLPHTSIRMPTSLSRFDSHLTSR